MKSVVRSLATLAMVVAGQVMQAQTIVSATGAVINRSGPGFGLIEDTYNQNGLFTNYVSGVTNFAAYMSTSPRHSLVFAGNEWFSNEDSTRASVTYSLGAVMGIDKVALWNEESSGIGTLDLYGSIDGVNFSALALNLHPTDNPLADYYADVFSFGAVSLQYIRFDMSDCPQPDPGFFMACGIGEVAFESGDVETTPEPATLALFAPGLLGLVAVRRRKKA